MIQSDLCEDLRLETGAALGRLATAEDPPGVARGESPGTGELFVSARSAELPVEWLVVRRGEDGRWLVVAADTQPLVGSADVAVPAAASAGPLSLRCGFSAWVDARELDPELRTGTVEEIYVGYARHKLVALEAAGVRGSRKEREVDLDPTYREWCREVLEPARGALTTPGRENTAPETNPSVSPSPSRGWGFLAAAVTALVFAGLLAWVGILTAELQRGSSKIAELKRSLEELSEPVIAPQSLEITVGDQLRGFEPAPEVPSEPRLTTIDLYFREEIISTYDGFWVELRSFREEESFWKSPRQVLEPGVNIYPLLLRQAFLPEGAHTIEVEISVYQGEREVELHTQAVKVKNP